MNNQLWYGIGIDTEKLKQDANETSELFKDIGKSANDVAGKMTEAIKLSIFNQKQLIKEIGMDIKFGSEETTAKIEQQKQIIKDITADIERMSAARDKMPKVEDQSNANKDISAAKRALAEENIRLANLENQKLSEANEKHKELGIAVRELANQKKALNEAQKGAIGSLEDLKNKVRILTEAQSKMVIGSKEFREAQTKINDLNKQIKDSTVVPKETPSGVVDSLKNWALGLATVATAIKIAKDVIASTEATAHKFEQIITAATSATQFFFKAIASGDWTNFWEGLGKAIKGAVDYVDRLEKIENLKNEQLINSVKSRTKVGELRAQSYETTDPKKLKEIYTELIDEQQKNYDKEKVIRTEEKKLLLDKAETDSNVSKKVIENFVTEYSSLEKMLELGEKYNKLKEKVDDKVTMGGLKIDRSKEEKELSQLSKSAEQAGKYVDQIAKIPKEKRKEIAEIIAAEEAAKGAFDNANRRDKEKLKNIKKKEEEDAVAAAKKAIEDAELDNRIKATQEAMKTATGEQLTFLAKKLALLEAEKTLRENIVKLAVFTAKYDSQYGGAPVMISATGGKGLINTDFTPKKQTVTLQKDLEKDAAEMVMQRSSWTKKELTEYDETAKAAQDAKEKKLDALNAIMGGLNTLNSVLHQSNIEYGATGDNLMEYLNSVADIASGVLTMNPGQVLQGLIGYADSLFKIFSKEDAGAEKYAETIKKINELLAEQQRIVSQSERKGAQDEAYKKQIDLLLQQKATIEKAITDEQNRKGKFLWGLITWDATSNKKIEELKGQLNDLTQQIEETGQAMKDLEAGGITEGTLSDTIAQAFMDGKTSVDDFAQYINKMLKDAVLNSFKASILGKQLTETQEYLANALGDKNLSVDEVKKFQDMMKQAVDNAKPIWDQLNASIDAVLPSSAISDTTRTASTKGFAAMSQDTGNELNGRFTAIQGHTFNISETVKVMAANGANMLARLTGIENNTKRLEAIESDMKATRNNLEIINLKGITLKP
jgi:hypothetical protein